MTAFCAQRTLRSPRKPPAKYGLDYLFHKRVPASMLATIACASATSGNAGLTRTPLSSTPRGACGPIAGAAEKGVLGELEWRPSLSRSRVTADALDHGAHAIRALWRKMLLEAQPAKSAQGVDGENLLRRAIGEYRDRDRD
jgi:hypothetical protein